MSTIEIHAADCPKSWDGYQAMDCECEPVQAPAPIAAPQDWNDEARAIVATYASDTTQGYALNVEPVDMSGYNPYFRSTSRRSVIESFAS